MVVVFMFSGYNIVSSFSNGVVTDQNNSMFMVLFFRNKEKKEE
jgi:hypothetical protein